MSEVSNNLNLFTNPITQAYPDLLKDFLFQVVFQFNSNTAVGSLFSGELGTYGDMGDLLTLRARSIQLPQKKTELISTHYMGAKRNYPGRTSVDGTVTIKFDEFQDQMLAKSFYEWQNMIYNHGFPTETGRANTNWFGSGAISKYLSLCTATIQVKLFDSTLSNESQLPFTWYFYECFPTDNGTTDLNMEGNGKVSPSVTFNYNTFEMRQN